MIARRLQHRPRIACPIVRRRGRLSGCCFPAPPCPCIFSEAHQGVHDTFVRLKTRVGHVCHRREKYIKQEGREHATLTLALFHGEPPQAHAVIESHACPHGIVEVTDDRNNPLRHAEAGEYRPQEWSVHRVIRFGEIDGRTSTTGFVSSSPTPVADESRTSCRL